MNTAAEQTGPGDQVQRASRMCLEDYRGKGAGYFAAARRSFVDILPPNPAGRLLEIGCGNGETAAYALAQGKCGWCCGIELCPGPATEAHTRLSQVIEGDIEQMSLDLPPGSFDVLLLSEVLEHLRDPASVLARLRALMRAGAIVVAGSPNVCHFSILCMLLRGEWTYRCEGILDETHLRWFSPASYRRLFEITGYVVDEVGPAYPLRTKARLVNSLLFGSFKYLFYPQIKLVAHCV
jgi:SAM-dependent methyltransferase